MTTATVMHKAEQKYEVGKIRGEEHAKQRRIKGILNKLTPQNFEKLFEQVKEVNIDNVHTLSGLVAQIFEVSMEPTFVVMYGTFCSRLAKELPAFGEDNEKITFKKLLLNKFQEEFERGEREQEEANREEEGEVKQMEEEREEKRMKARRRMLGNIRLMGELYKKRKLTQRIMHVCIKKLLGQSENPVEENIESLCKLMSTIGEMIDHHKVRDHIDEYFGMMFNLSNNMKLSSRVRFMLKDVIDLRKNKWQQRNGGILSRPMRSSGLPGTMQHVHSSNRWLPSSQTMMAAMHKAERKYEVGKITDEEQSKQRRLKGILNKLTPQNLEELLEQVIKVNIDNASTLSGVIAQIFNASMEPTFVVMYVNFCSRLAVELPAFGEDNEKISFRGLLLNKCQEEFERQGREQEEVKRPDEEGELKQSEEERVDKRVEARRRMLGNIRLIGELYKKKMLTERIMHGCINKLLDQSENPNEENIESLCKLMSTIGEMIDHPKASVYIDGYFETVSNLSNNMKLSSRVRFMLKDVMDLRKNRWQQRRKVEGPKKIKEVHWGAAQERQAQFSRLAGILNPVQRGQPVDYGPKSSNSNTQMGGYCGLPQQLRGFGNQDSRFEERRTFENRTLTVPFRPRYFHDGVKSRPSPWVSATPQSDPSGKVDSEDHLHDKSLEAIKDFYSARDEKEVALCIKDLNSPGFYPTMISIWVTDSFERKDMDREALTKLVINLAKSQDTILTQDSLVKGFESVLSTLEDAVTDAPKAGEFLGLIFARMVLEGVIPYKEVCRLIYEGGEEQGRLVETGLAAEVLGAILEIIKSEKGNSFLKNMVAGSNLHVENFGPPTSGKKASRLDKFI